MKVRECIVNIMSIDKEKQCLQRLRIRAFSRRSCVRDSIQFDTCMFYHRWVMSLDKV